MTSSTAQTECRDCLLNREHPMFHDFDEMYGIRVPGSRREEYGGLDIFYLCQKHWDRLVQYAAISMMR